jgi:hypothetical protein
LFARLRVSPRGPPPAAKKLAEAKNEGQSGRPATCSKPKVQGTDSRPKTIAIA